MGSPISELDQEVLRINSSASVREPSPDAEPAGSSGPPPDPSSQADADAAAGTTKVADSVAEDVDDDLIPTSSHPSGSQASVDIRTPDPFAGVRMREHQEALALGEAPPETPQSGAPVKDLKAGPSPEVFTLDEAPPEVLTLDEPSEVQDSPRSTTAASDDVLQLSGPTTPSEKPPPALSPQNQATLKKQPLSDDLREDSLTDTPLSLTAGRDEMADSPGGEPRGSAHSFSSVVPPIPLHKLQESAQQSVAQDPPVVLNGSTSPLLMEDFRSESAPSVAHSDSAAPRATPPAVSSGRLSTRASSRASPVPSPLPTQGSTPRASARASPVPAPEPTQNSTSPAAASQRPPSPGRLSSRSSTPRGTSLLANLDATTAAAGVDSPRPGSSGGAAAGGNPQRPPSPSPRPRSARSGTATPDRTTHPATASIHTSTSLKSARSQGADGTPASANMMPGSPKEMPASVNMMPGSPKGMPASVNMMPGSPKGMPASVNEAPGSPKRMPASPKASQPPSRNHSRPASSSLSRQGQARQSTTTPPATSPPATASFATTGPVLETSKPPEFDRIVVEGEPSRAVRTRKTPTPINHKLTTSKLKILCVDHTTGAPIPNAVVHTNTLEGTEHGRERNFSKALGSMATTGQQGTALCRLISNRTYVVTATCEGYHKFGSLGEYLLITPTDNEILERVLPMQPIRVAVVVTLRELQPLLGKGLKLDPHGQVNALERPPEPPKDSSGGPAPQKVSFVTPAGTRQSFMATAVETDHSLTIASKAKSEDVGKYSTDVEGHCFLYGPRVDGLRTASASLPVGGAGEKSTTVWKHAGNTSNVKTTDAYTMLPSRRSTGKSMQPEQSGRSASPTRQWTGLHDQYPTFGYGSEPDADRNRFMNYGYTGNGSGLSIADEAAVMGVTDPKGIHNFIPSGDYNMALVDPSKLLIFYTYTGDKEQAQINKVQNSVVPFTMNETDISQLSATSEQKVRFPVQLYCRARPWLQILVIDSVTLQEVGVEYKMHFKVERVDHYSSMPFRIAKLKAAISQQFDAGNPDPTDCPEGRADPRALEFLVRRFKKGRLAGLWARAELAQLDGLRETGESPEPGSMQRQVTDINTVNTMWDGTANTVITSNDFEDTERDIYENLIEGSLSKNEAKSVATLVSGGVRGVTQAWGADELQEYSESGRAMEEWEPPRRTYLTPGEIYAVTLTLENPFVEMSMRQTRISNWELEPFVFFAHRKVKLLVGVREIFTRAPLSRMAVTLKVLDYPRPPRPPAVKPEWCEEPAAYAKRLLDQLIDFVVQSRHEQNEERVALDLQTMSDSEGVAEFMVPPRAKVALSIDTGTAFEIKDSTSELTLTTQPEQFLGMGLERMCYTQAYLLDAETEEGIAGFQVKVYNITEKVSGMSDPAFSISNRRRNVHIDQDLMAQACREVSIEGMEPIYTGETGSNGKLVTPIVCQAGTFIKLVVTKAPYSHLLPEYYQRGSGAMLVSAFNVHKCKFMVPRKPKVQLTIADSCTMEKLMGVRFRVLVKYTQAPLIPEGEATHTRDPRDWPSDGKETKPATPRIPVEGGESGTPGKQGTDDSSQAATSPNGGDSLASQGGAKTVPGDGPPLAPLLGMEGEKNTSPRNPWDPTPPEGSASVGAAPLAPLLGMDDAAPLAPLLGMDNAAPLAPLLGMDDAAPLASLLGMDDAAPLAPLLGMDDQKPLPPLMGMEDEKNTPPEEGAAPSWLKGDTAEAAPPTNESVYLPLGDKATPTEPAGSGGGLDDGSPGGTAFVRQRGKDLWDAGGASIGPGRQVGRLLKESAPEALENEFGRIWYDTCTGWPESDNLVVDEGTEIMVQVLPSWPFSTNTLTMTYSPDGWRDPPHYMFRLPRSDTAFQFWMERDKHQVTFYDANGDPKKPYHQLARLQPNAVRTRVLDYIDNPQPALLKNLSSAHTTPVRLSSGTPGLQSDPMVPQYENSMDSFKGDPKNPYHQLARQQPNAVRTGEFDQIDSTQPASLKNLSSAHATQVGSASAVPRPSNDQVEADLQSQASVLQFENNMDSFFKVRHALWEQLRMSDIRYVPLERMTLASFLAKWAAFPHIQGAPCRACTNSVNTERKPYTVRASPVPAWMPTATATHVITGTEPNLAGGSATMGGQFKSYLLRSSRVELTARWAYDRFSMTMRSTSKSPGIGSPTKIGINKYPKSHDAINNHSESAYCKGPYFTWWQPDGTAVHVGVIPKLYADLIPLIDSTAASLELMDEHIAKVKAQNAYKQVDGRFLLGQNSVEGCLGGVFVLDDSMAMPYGGTLFVLEQIAGVWDSWFAQRPDDPPQVNILLVAGGEISQLRKYGMVRPEKSNKQTLKDWYLGAKKEVSRNATGFLISGALRQAFYVADMTVPVYLICGGLTEKLRESGQSISAALHEAQLACISRKGSMHPVHTIEVLPVPKLEEEMKRMNARAPKEAVKEYGQNYEDQTYDHDREYQHSKSLSGSPVAPAPGCGDLQGEPGIFAPMPDIFGQLRASLEDSQSHLEDLFNEADTDGNGLLDAKELYSLLLKLVPEAGTESLRYLQLMLDSDGDQTVSYKHLSSALKAGKTAGSLIQLKEHLEAQMVLIRVAFIMVSEEVTAEEVFDRYDKDEDGQWNHAEQWRMLKGIFPSLTKEEQSELFGSLQDMDVDQDDYITRAEFNAAFAQAHASDELIKQFESVRDRDELLKARTANGNQGPDNVQVLVARSVSEHEILKKVVEVDYPIYKILIKISGSTRGEHRRMDLGHGLAYADAIDIEPLLKAKANLEKRFQQMLEFEQHYGQVISSPTAGESPRSSPGPPKPATGPPSGLGSSLTADPPSPPRSVRSMASTVSRSAWEHQERVQYQPKPRSASTTRSRPKTAPFGRTYASRDAEGGARSQGGVSVVAPLPANSRLLSNTLNRESYMNDVAASQNSRVSSSLLSNPRGTMSAREGARSSRRPSGGSGDITAPRTEYVPPSMRESQTRSRPTSAPSRRQDGSLADGGRDMVEGSAGLKSRPTSAFLRPASALIPTSPSARSRPASAAQPSHQVEFNPLKTYAGPAVEPPAAGIPNGLKKKQGPAGFKGLVTYNARG